MKVKTLIFSIALFIPILIATVSCGLRGSGWKGTIEEENGVIVVRNPMEPVYSAGAIVLEEELSIGDTLEGREEYIFSDIRHIAVDDKERIYILNSKESSIRVFDKKGQYLKTVGRQGQGPGELYFPASIDVNRDVLFVNQTANRRMTFFSLEGELLRDLTTKGTFASRARVDSQGNIIVEDLFWDEKELQAAYVHKKFDSHMNLKAEIVRQIDPYTKTGYVPFKPTPYFLIDRNDNIVYGYPDNNYELQIFNPEGKMIKRILKDYEPIKIPERVIERTKERAEKSGQRYEFKIDFRPAYQRFFLDDEGRIFVITWERAEDINVFFTDIFDSEGRFIAKSPLKMKPYICKKQKLYSIEEDDDGYLSVKRYKINWNMRS